MSNYPVSREFQGRGTSHSKDGSSQNRRTPRRKQQQHDSAMKPLSFPKGSPNHSKNARKGHSVLLAKLNSSQSSHPLLHWHTNVKVDSWDSSNQKKMNLLEQRQQQTGSSIQELYKRFQQMRETERTEMEKRGLVDRPDARKSLSAAITFIGTCPDMCPVFERVRRILENNVMPLEKGENHKKVKAFSRPAAGQPPPLPSDVRPPSVLKESLTYLVENALPELPSSHAFLWDRTRSIRQDFTYQNYAGDEAVWCHEVIARIHLVCIARMSAAASEPGSEIEWSEQQEREQLNKCLQSLSEFYNLARAQGIERPNEPEMRAYELLSHLWDSERAAAIDRLPVSVRDHPLVKQARELRALATGPAPFSHAFLEKSHDPSVPPLIRCSLLVHIDRVRRLASGQLTRSLHHRSGMYPFQRFTKLLALLDERQAREFCDHYDLIVSTQDVSNSEVDMKSWSDQNISDKLALQPVASPALLNALDSLSIVAPVTGMMLKAPSLAIPIGQTQLSQPFTGRTENPTQQSPGFSWPVKETPQAKASPSATFGADVSRETQRKAAIPPTSLKRPINQQHSTAEPSAFTLAQSNATQPSIPKISKLPGLPNTTPVMAGPHSSNGSLARPAIKTLSDRQRTESTQNANPITVHDVPSVNEQRVQQRAQQRMKQREAFINSFAGALVKKLIRTVVSADVEKEAAAATFDRRILLKSAWAGINQQLTECDNQRKREAEMEVDAAHANAELQGRTLQRRPRMRRPSFQKHNTELMEDELATFQALAHEVSAKGLRSICVVGGWRLPEDQVSMPKVVETAELEGIALSFSTSGPSHDRLPDLVVNIGDNCTEYEALEAISRAMKAYQPRVSSTKHQDGEVSLRESPPKKLRPNDELRLETLRSALRPSRSSQSLGSLSNFDKSSFRRRSGYSIGDLSRPRSYLSRRDSELTNPEEPTSAVARLQRSIAEAANYL